MMAGSSNNSAAGSSNSDRAEWEWDSDDDDLEFDENGVCITPANAAKNIMRVKEEQVKKITAAKKLEKKLAKASDDPKTKQEK